MRSLMAATLTWVPAVGCSILPVRSATSDVMSEAIATLGRKPKAQCPAGQGGCMQAEMALYVTIKQHIMVGCA